MSHHRTAKVRPPDPRIEIDAAIAGLMKQCWRLGLQTRFCCQGDNPDEEEAPPPFMKGEAQSATITFADFRQAMLFAAAAGPMAWTKHVHQQRDRENHARREPWRWAWWRWLLEGATVRFPTRDIPRAEAQLRICGALLVPPATAARIGADTTTTPGAPSRAAGGIGAPRFCPRCGGLVQARRRDARYCSRRCQLAARQRGR